MLTEAERFEFELQQEDQAEIKYLRETYEAPPEVIEKNPGDQCSHERVRWYDYGIYAQTGYHDCGYICKDCGERLE